jgi:hypothetical protein
MPMEPLELTIILQEDEMNAVIAEHGSYDYIQTYVTAYAQHLVGKHAENVKSGLLKRISSAPVATLATWADSLGG